MQHSTSIRFDWMYSLGSAAQGAACQLANGKSHNDVCKKFLGAGGEPLTRIEELILAGFVLEVALGGFGNSPAERRARIERALDVLVAQVRTDRERVFADTAAAAILKNFCHPLNVVALATELGCHPSTLRRAFVREFGMSMRDYHLGARVAEADKLFKGGTTDVAAVAHLVGYKSGKNFYRAVRKIFGITPAQLRSRRES